MMNGISKFVKIALASSLFVAQLANAQTKTGSKVLVAKEASCGGYVALEKNPDSTLQLKVHLSDKSQCKTIRVDSMNVYFSLKYANSKVALDAKSIGQTLIVEMNNETLLIDLSAPAIQKELQTSKTKEEIKSSNAAGIGILIGAILVGGAAVAVEGAEEGMR